MDGGATRLRRIVDQRFVFVVATLICLAVAGGAVTWGTHVDPGTTTETRTVATWESQGTFAHRATVVNGTDALANGTVLRNRSAYFKRLSPVLEGAFTYRYRASEGGDLEANATLVLVIRSVEQRPSGGDVVYWSMRRPLGQTRTASLAPGDRLRVPFASNLTRALERANEVEAQFGTTPGTPQVHLVARLDLSGTRNGEPVDAVRTYRLPVSHGQGVYRVGPQPNATHAGEMTREVTVPATYGPLRRLGGPLVAATGLALVAGVGYARWNGRLSVPDEDVAALGHRRQRAEFDEWITTGRVPRAATDGPRIQVDSLAGLVDAAIDMDQRVIEDTRRGSYLFVADGTTYVYEPPSAIEAGGVTVP